MSRVLIEHGKYGIMVWDAGTDEKLEATALRVLRDRLADGTIQTRHWSGEGEKQEVAALWALVEDPTSTPGATPVWDALRARSGGDWPGEYEKVELCDPMDPFAP